MATITGKPHLASASVGEIETALERDLRECWFARVIDPNGGYYVGDLPPERIAEVLATAAGHVGSMADYLYQTVKHLADLALLWGRTSSCGTKVSTNTLSGMVPKRSARMTGPVVSKARTGNVPTASRARR